MAGGSDVSLISVPKSLSQYLDGEILNIWSTGAGAAKVLRLQTYIDEAVFFFSAIQDYLRVHKPGTVLEVGSGIGLLSLLMSTEGPAVISLEPESAGFGSMVEFRELIVKAWKGPTGVCEFSESKLEDLSVSRGSFDLVVAINVIEHVPAYEILIEEMVERASEIGSVWVVCPNYAFPFEQHLSIPILVNKRITWLLMRGFIRNSLVEGEVEDFWADLSWPTHTGIKKMMSQREYRYSFSRALFRAYVERLTEPRFVARKGPLFSLLIGFRPLLRFVATVWPFGALPVIEFWVYKNGMKRSSAEFSSAARW